MAGTGEVVILEGADHLLAPAGGLVFDRLMAHLPAVLADGHGVAQDNATS